MRQCLPISRSLPLSPWGLQVRVVISSSIIGGLCCTQICIVGIALVSVLSYHNEFMECNLEPAVNVRSGVLNKVAREGAVLASSNGNGMVNGRGQKRHLTEHC